MTRVTLMNSFDRLSMGFYLLHIDTYDLSLSVLLNYLAGSKSASARPDTMTTTALEAIDSSTGSNGNEKSGMRNSFFFRC